MGHGRAMTWRSASGARSSHRLLRGLTLKRLRPVDDIRSPGSDHHNGHATGHVHHNGLGIWPYGHMALWPRGLRVMWPWPHGKMATWPSAPGRPMAMAATGNDMAPGEWGNIRPSFTLRSDAETAASHG